MTLRVKKLHPDAVIPTRTSPHSVGYDLYSMEDITVPSMDRRIVSTGVCATLPPGVYGRIAPRSGMTLNMGFKRVPVWLTLILRVSSWLFFLILDPKISKLKGAIESLK